jgi:putative ABC transport system permease protein
MLDMATVRMALRALMANRLRSLLTMLGIVIGVAAVISLVAYGQGATASVESAVEGLGSNLLIISPGAASSSGFISATQSPITLQDEQFLARSVPAVKYMAPLVSTFGSFTYGANSVSLAIDGTTAQMARVNPALQPAAGVFLTAADVQYASSVVVLGSQAADDLFGTANPSVPVGATVSLNGIPFTVMGVLPSQGQGGGSSANDTVYMPISTVVDDVTGLTSLSSIYASAQSPSAMTMATAEIDRVLEAVQEQPAGASPDFTVTSQSQVLSTLSSVSSTLTTLLGAIAGISLLVGGIGIMNIMLVSVTERTREIGVRKAIGARRSDILAQFLLEAIFLSLAGGIIGVGLGYFTTVVGTSLLGTHGLPSGGATALALGFSVAVGVGFGIYPAIRASRLMPMQALRYE